MGKKQLPLSGCTVTKAAKEAEHIADDSTSSALRADMRFAEDIVE